MTRKHNVIASTPAAAIAPITPEYLDSTEAGELLRVSERVVGQYIRDKGLKASRIGKRLIIARHDLDEFVRSRAVTGTAA